MAARNAGAIVQKWLAISRFRRVAAPRLARRRSPRKRSKVKACDWPRSLLTTPRRYASRSRGVTTYIRSHVLMRFMIQALAARQSAACKNPRKTVDFCDSGEIKRGGPGALW